MLHTLRPRVVELGKIKIGKKDSQVRKAASGNTYRAPQKLDHFIITGLERDSAGDLKEDRGLMSQLAAITGAEDGRLTEIPIVLLSDEIDEVLQAAYVWYDRRSVTARCDGTTCTWYRDSKGQPIEKSTPCDGEHDRLVGKDGKKRFKAHGTLNVVISGGESRFGGVYKFRTTSMITLEQLYGGLLHIQALTGGVLRGIPLRLVVRPLEVSPEGKATTVYVCHIELRGTDLTEIQRQAVALSQMNVQRRRELQAVKREYLALVAAPGERESDEEQADIAEEFHPGPENALPGAPDAQEAEFEEEPAAQAFPEPPAASLPSPPADPAPVAKKRQSKAPPQATKPPEPPAQPVAIDDLPF